MTWFTHHPRQVRGSPWVPTGAWPCPQLRLSFPGSPGMGGDTQALCLDTEVALRGPPRPHAAVPSGQPGEREAWALREGEGEVRRAAGRR